MTQYARSMSLAEMPLVNGRFDIWPDSTSLTAAGFLGAVHSLVALGTSGAATVNRQSFTAGQTAVPGEPVYFLRWNQTTAATAGTPEFLSKIEDVRTFAAQKIVVQGYYRSNTAFDVKVKQDFGSGGSPSADVTTVADGPITQLASTVDSSGTAQWQPFTLQFTVPSISGKTIGSTANTHYLGLRYLWPLNTTFQVDLADVRVHKGERRIPVQYTRPVYEEERLLGRYYQTYAAYAPVSTQSANFVTFPQGRMRAAPTMSGGTGSTLANPTADGHSIISTGAAAQITGIIADARIAD